MSRLLATMSRLLATMSTIAIHRVLRVLRILRLVARSVHPAHGCRPLVPGGLAQRAPVMKRTRGMNGILITWADWVDGCTGWSRRGAAGRQKGFDTQGPDTCSDTG